jgi:peptidoglycan/LPS O-acetylase OafA/YrhL
MQNEIGYRQEAVLELNQQGPAKPKLEGQFKLGYQPALDGLRAISVVIVIAFHCGVKILCGGFVGVDLFFVLSGFLITKLLLDEHEQSGRIHFRNFYLRRSLRLMPGLFLFAGTYLLLAPILFPMDKCHLLGTLSLITYTTNFRAMVGEPAYSPILNHGWSLALEEHFYLIWPVLLLVLLRLFRSPKLVAVFLLLFSATVFSLRCWLLSRESWIISSQSHLVRLIYHSSYTRADSPAIGCVLALLIHSAVIRIGIARWWLFPALLTVCVLIGAYANNSYYYHVSTLSWGFTATAFLAVAMIYLLLIPSRSPIHLLLRCGPLVWIGRISYGIYLWHNPVVRYLQLQPNSLTKYCERQGAFWNEISITLAAIAITIPLATVSYYFVERPMLRLKTRYQREKTDHTKVEGTRLPIHLSFAKCSLKRILHWWSLRKMQSH